MKITETSSEKIFIGTTWALLIGFLGKIFLRVSLKSLEWTFEVFLVRIVEDLRRLAWIGGKISRGNPGIVSGKISEIIPVKITARFPGANSGKYLWINFWINFRKV